MRGENLVFGFGEISTSQTESWYPEKWGMKIHPFEDLAGGDLSRNLQIMRSLLDGEGPDGPEATIAMNASVAFRTCGKTKSLEEGLELTQSLISEGKVKEWVEQSFFFLRLNNRVNYFGTDGIRGPYGGPVVNQDFAYSSGASFEQVCGRFPPARQKGAYGTRHKAFGQKSCTWFKQRSGRRWLTTL